MLKLRKQQNDFEKQQKAAFSTIKSSEKRSRHFLLQKGSIIHYWGKSALFETRLYFYSNEKNRVQILDFEAMSFS